MRDMGKAYMAMVHPDFHDITRPDRAPANRRLTVGSENTETGGGTRYSKGKPPYHMIPALGLEEVAYVSGFGAEKYDDFDYRKGQKFSTLVRSGFSHMVKVLWKGPRSVDDESGRLHAAHVAWNMLLLCGFIRDGEDDLDDLSTKLNEAADAREASRAGQG